MILYERVHVRGCCTRIIKLAMYINIPEHKPFNLEPEPHSLIRRSPYQNYIPVFCWRKAISEKA